MTIVGPSGERECRAARPGWEGSDDRHGCALPKGHRGYHRNVVGYEWGEGERLPAPGRLLYGVASPRLLAMCEDVDGVFRLPRSSIIVVSHTGLVRLFSHASAPSRWASGRMELLIDGELLILWPVLDA
ncbi:hypothetical protein J4H86_08690 [Spiractinospora alimapuensis]|uniref:hypothetical protein n=1 Tax=Spiractinospora alimapuensis TaxID=2820884 RepID=UPI001F3FAD05|nr:hypothetical protein [Spiractinospora alimapuensis]QVQ53772.1 hypothetical protein J4H86_08690 [Spiractinospora alimapuensis]